MKIKRILSGVLSLAMLLTALLGTAVLAGAEGTQTIEAVEITGVTIPQAGQTADTSGIAVSPADLCQVVPQWQVQNSDTGEFDPFTGTFAVGSLYRLHLELQPMEGCEFGTSVTVRVDGIQRAFRRVGEVLVLDEDFMLEGTVEKLAITGVTTPKAGQKISVDTIQVPEDSGCRLVSAQWYIYEYTTGQRVKVSSGTFRKGAVYELELYLEPATGFVLSDDVDVTVDGQPPQECWMDQSAVQITNRYPVDVKEISQLEILELIEPVVGEKMDTDSIAVPENADYTVKSAVWSMSDDDETYVQAGGRYMEDMYYRITLELRPLTEGFVFAEELKVTLNGETVGSARVEADMFTCTVTYTYGPLSNEEPPEILQQPQNITAVSGEDITFYIQAQGEGLTYQWYLNGQKLVDSEMFRGTTTATLMLKADGETCWLDGASVYCQVTNEKGGYIKSDTAVLTVEHKDADDAYTATDAGHHLNCVCGERFDAGEHAYDNDCDSTCNVCNYQRGVAGHVDNDGDGKCDNCGDTLVKKGGSDAQDSGKQDTQKKGDSNNGTLWLLIILAVIIVGCIGTVVTLLVLRREQ